MCSAVTFRLSWFLSCIIISTKNLMSEAKKQTEEYWFTLCLQGNFSCFFVGCWFFSKSTFSKNSFWNTIRVSNSLDPDQARHFVGPGLGPNCLQSLSADDISRQRANIRNGRTFYSIFPGSILKAFKKCRMSKVKKSRSSFFCNQE